MEDREKREDAGERNLKMQERGEKMQERKEEMQQKKIYPFGCNINYFSYICTRKGIIILNVYLYKSLQLWTCLYLLLLKSAASSST